MKVVFMPVIVTIALSYFARAMDNRLFIQVNQRTFANMSILNLSMSEAVNIACCYDTTFIRTPPYPTFTEVGGPHIELKQSDTSPIECLGYDVPESSKSSKSHTYTCTSKRPVLHVEIVLIYSRQATPSGTPPSSGTPPLFSGLNPLIYTISAVILLGTLAIVAILTCWIRARRSFNNRVIRPDNTSQDYFNYITDNEFTPLTSSEFAASLQERPPTYIESERIEQSGRTEENEAGSSLNRPLVQPSLLQQNGTVNQATFMENRNSNVATEDNISHDPSSHQLSQNINALLNIDENPLYT